MNPLTQLERISILPLLIAQALVALVSPAVARADAVTDWVAEDGKRLLGHVCVQLIEKIPNPVNEPELHAYLTNFYVIPEMRGQGLGKQLLNKALSWCRTRETDAVILWATLASRSLYRRCGLVEPTDIFELRHSARREH